METLEIHSKKSNSIYTVSGRKERTFLTVTGEACYKAKVQKEIERIRRSGATWDEAVWTAKMLASTY
jgi:hypothetical protein